MSGDLDLYAGDNRGCRIDVLPTSRNCPDCGKRMRLVGRMILFKLKLECPGCDYRSDFLSREELQELL